MKIIRNLGQLIASILVLLMLGSDVSFSAESSGKKLVMATPEGEGIFTRYLEKLYAALSRDSGIYFVIKEYPKKRALAEANYGHVDGLAARIKGLQSSGLPDLRIIPVSHFNVQHVLFARQPNIISAFKSIDDLTFKRRIIGFLRGSKKAGNLLKAHPDQLKIALENPLQAFNLLLRNRYDAFLAGPAIASRALLNKKFPNSGIKEIATVSKTPLYPYVNKRHLNLIPTIEKSLRKLKDNGTITQIRKILE